MTFFCVGLVDYDDEPRILPTKQNDFLVPASDGMVDIADDGWYR